LSTLPLRETQARPHAILITVLQLAKAVSEGSLLRIGDFSRLARVTIRTLRFYDEAGLFRPARIDPGSGYRYYRADQLTALQRVRQLRSLGCTIEEVRNLTASPTDSQRHAILLGRLRRRLMVSLARDEQRLKQLDVVMRSSKGPDSPHDLWSVEELPILPVNVAFARDRVRSLGTEVEHMFEAVEALVAKRGCRAAISPFLLFHDMEYREVNVEVEVCVPVTPESVDACGGRLVPGAERAACSSFIGAYEQVPRVYECMLTWMEGAAARIAGPIRESYVRFGANQVGYTLPPQLLASDASMYQTDILIPITSA
jgi:DNA-binding transcriptional MerR regulator